jgi:hypothetical protein
MLSSTPDWHRDEVRRRKAEIDADPSKLTQVEDFVRELDRRAESYRADPTLLLSEEEFWRRLDEVDGE